jgi:hypothetical protein
MATTWRQRTPTSCSAGSALSDVPLWSWEITHVRARANRHVRVARDGAIECVQQVTESLEHDDSRHATLDRRARRRRLGEANAARLLCLRDARQHSVLRAPLPHLLAHTCDAIAFCESPGTPLAPIVSAVDALGIGGGERGGEMSPPSMSSPA